MLERAKRIFLEINDLTALAHNHQTPLAYPMSIGIIPTIAPFLLPKVLPTLNERYPHFSLNIVEKQTERLIEQVRYGHIDTAIIALPYPVDGLHIFEFWQEDFFAIFAKDDPKANLKSMSSSELSQTNLLLLGEGHCLTDQVLSVCSLDRNKLNTSFFDASLNTLIQMSLAGMGTTLVPQMALDQLGQNKQQLQVVPLSEKGPHRRLAFISRLNYARVEDIRLLSKVFKEILQLQAAKASSVA